MFNKIVFIKKSLLLASMIMIAGVSVVTAQEETENISCSLSESIELGRSMYTFDIEFDGQDRFYNLFVPESYNPEQALPLVISLHGARMTPAIMSQLTLWHELGEQEGFITAYPSGVRNTWNDGAQTQETVVAIDDVAFIEHVIEDISNKLCIDETRIFSTGFSNGSEMAARLVCDLPDRFAAVGLAAGGHFVPLNICDDEDTSIPVIAFFGTEDTVVPFEGGTSSILAGMGIDELPTVRDGIMAWANLNGCEDEAIEEMLTDEVTRFIFGGCDNDVEIILHVIYNGGHTWPGSSVPVLGNTTQDIDATATMWEFFKNHSQ